MAEALRKIAIISYPGLSGITHYSYSLYKELININQNVLFITNKRALFVDEKVDNNIVKIFDKTRYLLLTYFQFIIYVLCQRLSVLHFQSWIQFPIIDFFLVLLLKLFRVKIIFTVHDILPRKVRFYHKMLFRLFYLSMDFIIVHSEVIRKDLLQLVNSATKVAIIPHGLYDMFRNKIAVSQDAAKSELGLSASKKIVLFFGSIAERKGASQLLLNMKKILQRDPDITLLMAGVSYYDKGYLENILKQNNIQDSVKIVNKWIPDDQCEYYFAASDVVILPYKDVSTSGILKLAYAFYKPIIATSVGELPEIIEADKSGIIVNFEMSDEDCDNVVALLSSNKRLSEISNDIKNVVETKYSWKMIAIETNKIYESLISGII